MENFNWQVPLGKNIIMLKLLGLWPSGNETYKLNFYTLYATFTITIFTVCNNLSEILSIFFVHGDLQDVIQTFFVSVSHGAGVLKSYYLIRNMKLLKELMVTRNNDTFRVKNQRQLELVEPNLKIWKFTYNVFSSMVVFSATAFSLFPVLDKSVRRHQLPIAAWFPFNYTTSPYYELTYLYQVISMTFSGLIILNTDTLVAALNMLIGAQCDILCDNLRHVHKSEEFLHRCKDCVEHHKAILRFAEDSNRFFNWIILVQFFSSVIVLSTTMFQLAMVDLFGGEFFSCFWYENALCVQIFMYCWFGNQVEIKSSSITRAAFESDWTGAPLEFKKNLVLIILRSQKPIKVSAFNLFHLNLKTFMTIMRTSWSYFVVLQQVNGHN